MTLRVGDVILYTPTVLETDPSVIGVVAMVEPAGKIFRMDMLAIDEIDHWIPAADCVGYCGGPMTRIELRSGTVLSIETITN